MYDYVEYRLKFGMSISVKKILELYQCNFFHAHTFAYVKVLDISMYNVPVLMR